MGRFLKQKGGHNVWLVHFVSDAACLVPGNRCWTAAISWFLSVKGLGLSREVRASRCLGEYAAAEAVFFDGRNRVGACCMPWHIPVMSDYERIARIIHYIDDAGVEQLDLSSLAEFAGVSLSCLCRLCSRWAGVAPDVFVRMLTLEHRRLLLKEGNRVLDCSIESGIFGAGRHHDPCVSLEVASSEEVRSGGAGWKVVAGFSESPFGKCLIAEGSRGVCYLSFVEESNTASTWGQLLSLWPRAEVERSDHLARELCRRVFYKERLSPRGEGVSSSGALKLFVKGTEFQVKVWRALLRIPEGRLVSYGKLARFVGAPKAFRAVGAAMGRNSIGYLIPCHRVILETGGVGGYAWGMDRKRAIQAYESALIAG